MTIAAPVVITSFSVHGESLLPLELLADTVSRCQIPNSVFTAACKPTADECGRMCGEMAPMHSKHSPLKPS